MKEQQVPPDARSSRRADLVAALSFVVLALAVFHEATFGGRHFFFRDLALQWHPQAEAFVRAVASGSWPVWNPHVSFGQPLLANPNSQVLYPFTWLHLLMPAWTFYTWYAVFHFALAGFGVHVLARHLGLSRGAALVAGVLWVLSGPFLSLVNLWNHLAGAAWLPWIVTAGDRALERPSARRALAWGASIATTVLVGSPETALMAAGGGAFLAVRHLRPWWRSPRRIRLAAAVTGLALAFALALSAGQWLPTWDIARASARADMPMQSRSYWSIHPWILGQVALPVFPDRLFLHDDLRARWYESREPFLGSLYLGLPAMALFAAGLLDGRTRRWTVSLAALALLSVLFAAGRYTPLYETVVTIVPPLRSLRFPAKAMVLASFCAALCGGCGFDAWRQRRGADAAWTVLALAMLLAGAAVLGGGRLLAYGAEEWGSALILRGRRSYAEVLAPTARTLVACGALAAATAVLAWLNRLRLLRAAWLAGALGVIAAADLALAHRDLNPTAPPGALGETPPVLSASQPRPHQRTFVFDYFRAGSANRLLGHHTPYVASIREEDWPGPWYAPLVLRSYGYSSLAALWGREESYSIDVLGLFSRDLMTVNRVFESAEQAPEMQLRLLRMAAVDTVVALHRSGYEALVPVTILPSPFIEPIRVFRVPGALPRAYVVGRARIAPVGQGWRALLAPDFAPEREVVLPEGPSLDSGADVGSCTIVEFLPDRVAIDAQLRAPGYVVLVDTYDPGWKATIDGQDAPVLRANVAFRALQVPAGSHRIRFLYRPASVRLGLAISALAAAVALASLVHGRLTRARAPA